MISSVQLDLPCCHCTTSLTMFSVEFSVFMLSSDRSSCPGTLSFSPAVLWCVRVFLYWFIHSLIKFSLLGFGPNRVSACVVLCCPQFLHCAELHTWAYGGDNCCSCTLWLFRLTSASFKTDINTVKFLCLFVPLDFLPILSCHLSVSMLHRVQFNVFQLFLSQCCGGRRICNCCDRIWG